MSTASSAAAAGFHNDLSAALIPAAPAARFRDHRAVGTCLTHRSVPFIPAVFHHEKHAQQLVHRWFLLVKSRFTAARKGNDSTPPVIPQNVTRLRDVLLLPFGLKEQPGSHRGRLITHPPIPLFPAVRSSRKCTPSGLAARRQPASERRRVRRRNPALRMVRSATDARPARSPVWRKSYARNNVTDSAGENAWNEELAT